MRQLDSHKVGSSYENKLNSAFKAFEIDRAEYVDNYLTACELIYDKINNVLINTNNLLL